jgi:hypothetical protein
MACSADLPPERQETSTNERPILAGSCLSLTRVFIKTQPILDANCLPTPAPRGLAARVPYASKAPSQAKAAGAEGTAKLSCYGDRIEAGRTLAGPLHIFIGPD